MALLCLLTACAPNAPAPIDVDLSEANAEAAALIRNLRQAAIADPQNADKRGELGLALEANGMPKAALPRPI